VVRTRVAGP